MGRNMSEVHRWEAVHMKDGDNNIRYQDGTGPDMVKASDYDQLKAENERLNKKLAYQDKVAKHFREFWQEIVDEPFTEWLNDDATHWICDEDAAFQAWQYLHQNKIWTMKEQTQLAIDERDTLRKQLDEARELLDRVVYQVGRTISDNLRDHVDAWLEANKV